MKRNKMTSCCLGLVLTLIVLFAGVQGARAALPCEGTIYLKLPDGWTAAYAAAGGNFIPFKKSSLYDGWYELSANSIGGTNDVTGFNIASRSNDYGQYPSITPKIITSDGESVQFSEETGFTCKAFGGNVELWIQPDPRDPSKPYFSGSPINVKYFYVFLPEDESWKMAVPMISEEGKDGVALNVDPNRCGWYFRRYINEEPPKEVVVYQDYDAEEKKNALKSFDLASKFEMLESDEVYLVAESDEWFATDPGVTGNCSFNLAAIIYDTDASLHGAFTCTHYEAACADNPDVCKNNVCYYASAPYNVVSSATAVVPCIGVTVGMVEDVLGENKKPLLTNIGKRCFGSNADESFAAMFNPTAGVNESYCIDVPFTRATNGKFEFDSDNYQSSGATVPGGFYPAERTPIEFLEGSQHLPVAENKRLAEGPVFFCADYGNRKTKTPEGLRTIHPTEGVAVSDLICNGPGWNGGIDCEGLFAAGSEFNLDGAVGQSISEKLGGVTWEGDGWGWSCPTMAPIGWKFYIEGTEKYVASKAANSVPEGNFRWTSGDSETEYGDVLNSGGRNQHFCFESHAKFRYKNGLRFSIRGDDDIWVYIDNKLAVDLGGTHFPAPGYVDLDKFMSDAEVGEYYDIDIFFCDRRTTMSNIRISTNMYIEQQVGNISFFELTEKNTGTKILDICYKEVSGCGFVMNANLADSECSEDISDEVHFSILNEEKEPVTGCNDCSSLPKGKMVHGGIDLSNPNKPKIHADSIVGLLPGVYYLVVDIKGNKAYYEFNVLENVIVKTDANAALAGMRVPVYVTILDDEGNVDLPIAAGHEYSLKASEGVVLYKDSTSEEPLELPYAGMVNSTGIDTLWVILPVDSIAAEAQTVTVSVRRNSVSLDFYTPTLEFAQPEMDALGNIVSWVKVLADPDTIDDSTSYFHWVGDDVELYLLLKDPKTDSLCQDCDYKLSLIEVPEGITGTVSALENGVAKVRFSSDSAYVDTSASVVVGLNKLISVAYGNLHFHVEPVEEPKENPNEEIKEDPKVEEPEDEPKKEEPKEEPKKEEPKKETEEPVVAKTKFSIQMTGPFQFAIVMEEDDENVKKAYAVMDVQGHVLRKGYILSKETVVPSLNAGSYVVKVGMGYRRVNIR